MQDPERAFLAWLEGFATEFKRFHPPTVATRAAHLIRHHYDRPFSLATLARRFHTSPSQLRRMFEREFGLSIREYQQRVRVKAALERVRTHKLDATALEVGYKGRQNFYRAFKQVTGLTPAAFRRLSEERALHIVQTVGAPRPRKQVAPDPPARH